MSLNRSKPKSFADLRRHPSWRLFVFSALSLILVAVAIVSIGMGAVEISPIQVLHILSHYTGFPLEVNFTEQQEAVLQALRLPRVALGLLVGAGLATAGAAMQGLFRNPLADPGLLGVSSGATVFAAASIVLGLNYFGIYSLPIFAFMGGLLAMFLVYSLSLRSGQADMTNLLLSGIAINSMCGAVTGFFTYISTEEQLRTISFWQLGSLAGATWTSVLSVTPLILLSILGLPLVAKALNALLLGESNAYFLGVRVEALKIFVAALVALAVGAGVAVSGMIGFVGLVVPHMVRMALGPDHRLLLPASALTGAILLCLADLLARTIVTPSELPIGIVTASVGSPFFFFLLLKNKRRLAA